MEVQRLVEEVLEIDWPWRRDDIERSVSTDVTIVYFCSLPESSQILLNTIRPYR